MHVSCYISHQKFNNHNQMFLWFSHSYSLELYHSFSGKMHFRYQIFTQHSQVHIRHSAFSEQPLLAERQEGVSTNSHLRRQKIAWTC